MQSKKDQLLAHNFMAARLRSAVLSGDADALQTPTRRFTIGMFVGATVAVLLVAAVGIIGYLNPAGNQKWRTPGQIVVQKDTGTRFLFVHGVLHPVANLASARLVVGAGAQITQASATSLKSVPHGATIGIVGAPDVLPAAGMLNASRWLVCASDSVDGDGVAAPDARVFIAGQRGAGSTVAAPVPVSSVSAFAVHAPDGTFYLVWHGRRLRIADASGLIALGFDRVAPIAVTATWLNSLPAGPDLTAPTIPGRGQKSSPVAGQAAIVGQIFVDTAADGSRGFYVMMTDGLMPLNATAAALLLAAPDTASAYPSGSAAALSVGTDQIISSEHSKQSLDWSGRPATPPTALGQAQIAPARLCVQIDASSGVDPRVQVVRALPDPIALPTVTNAAGDVFSVAADRGALVIGQSAPGTASGATYLVDDTGVRYALADADAQKLLGYSAVTPQPVPAALLDQLPIGPVLSQAAVVQIGAG
jgi:type VII secretion protein EccB